MQNFTKNIIDIKTTGGYSYTQIMNNPNCSKNPKYWYLIKDTENSNTKRYLFKSKVAESWEFFDPDILNPIRNTNQIYLRFLNVSKFVEPSNYFREYKEYPYMRIADTIQYNNYWDDIEDKIENGFEVDGVRITGRHFFLINFGRFRAIPVNEFGKAISKRKIWTFLRFLDHQYYMMHELEECKLEGFFRTWGEYKKMFPEKNQDDYEQLKILSFILTKARRKGWTAQIAIGIFVYNFVFQESSMNILAAYEKGHYGPMLRSIHNTKTFIDKNTPWKRRTDVKGTYEHFIASIEVKDDYGNTYHEGYLSEVQATSFKDNIFKSIGESADTINIEEPGKFPQLTQAFQVSIEPLIRDGETIIGSAIIGGSAGDIEGGGSSGLYEMMHKPTQYGSKGYSNIYEEKEFPENVGFFIDDLWYSPMRINKKELLKLDSSERTAFLINKFKEDYIDTVDEQGNSYRYFSELLLEEKRRNRKKVSSVAYNKFITQQPKYLSEAFLINENSPFDTASAIEVLGQLEVEKIGYKKGIFAIGTGSPVFKINMDLAEIDTYPYKGNDTTGCWVIYEDPINISREIPMWRYISGCDPIDYGTDETSSDGLHSNAVTYIIDTITRNIVAEYVGRPPKAEDYFEQLWRGLEYYNALLLYENNLKGLFSYFKLKNKLYLLADEPESLKSRYGYKVNNRIKGFHATAATNSYARELINTWSLEEVIVNQDTEGNNIYVPRMYFIKSKGLLQEIINWRKSDNFDRVSSLGATLILLFDKEYEEDEIKNNKSIMDTGLFIKLRDMMAGNKMKQFKF